MKKYLLLIVSIFMFASISEGYSQSCCPSGLYTSVTIPNIMNPVSGCKFSITYCYYNSPSGVRNIFICSISVPASQSQPPCDFSLFVLDKTFWDLVNYEIYIDLHTRIPFVPCNEGGGGPTNVIVVVSKAKCQRTRLDIPTDSYIVEACDEEPGLCENTYAVCLLSGNPITTHILGPILTGSGYCDDIDPEVNSNLPRCFNTCK